jgi:hypothetical protein
MGISGNAQLYAGIEWTVDYEPVGCSGQIANADRQLRYFPTAEAEGDAAREARLCYI